MNIKIMAIGFEDAGGNGEPKPQLFSEEEFYRSKNPPYPFPKGIKHLKLYRGEEIACSISLGTNVGESIESAEKHIIETKKPAALKRQPA